MLDRRLTGGSQSVAAKRGFPGFGAELLVQDEPGGALGGRRPFGVDGDGAFIVDGESASACFGCWSASRCGLRSSCCRNPPLMGLHARQVEPGWFVLVGQWRNLG